MLKVDGNNINTAAFISSCERLEHVLLADRRSENEASVCPFVWDLFTHSLGCEAPVKTLFMADVLLDLEQLVIISWSGLFTACAHGRQRSLLPNSRGRRATFQLASTAPLIKHSWGATQQVFPQRPAAIGDRPKLRNILPAVLKLHRPSRYHSVSQRYVLAFENKISTN